MIRNNEAPEKRDEAEPGIGAQMFTHIRTSIIATIVLAVIVCGIYPALVWGLAQAIFHNKSSGSLVKKDGTPTDNDAQAVGSALLGQPFAGAGYLHPRPSAAGNGYDPTASGGTNFGPMNAKLLLGTTRPTTLPTTRPGGQPPPGPDTVAFDGIGDRVVHYCLDNGIALESSTPIERFMANGNLDDVKLIEAFNDSNTPLKIKPAVEIPADAVTSSGSGLDPHISPRNAELQADRVAKARGITTEQVLAVVREHTDGPDLGFLGDPSVNVLMINLALDSKYPLPPPLTTVPAAAPLTQPVTLPTTQPSAK